MESRLGMNESRNRKAGAAPEGGNQGAGKIPVLPELGWGHWDGLEHLEILDMPSVGTWSFF